MRNTIIFINELKYSCTSSCCILDNKKMSTEKGLTRYQANRKKQNITSLSLDDLEITKKLGEIGDGSYGLFVSAKLDKNKNLDIALKIINQGKFIETGAVCDIYNEEFTRIPESLSAFSMESLPDPMNHKHNLCILYHHCANVKLFCILTYAEEILRGLPFLLEKGIIQRDSIEFQNLAIDNEGHARIVDFDIINTKCKKIPEYGLSQIREVDYALSQGELCVTETPRIWAREWSCAPEIELKVQDEKLCDNKLCLDNDNDNQDHRGSPYDQDTINISLEEESSLVRSRSIENLRRGGNNTPNNNEHLGWYVFSDEESDESFDFSDEDPFEEPVDRAIDRVVHDPEWVADEEAFVDGWDEWDFTREFADMRVMVEWGDWSSSEEEEEDMSY